MSELENFVEESVDPVEVEEVVEVETPEAEAEVEPTPEVEDAETAEAEEQEGLPTEPNKEVETGNVPIKALMAEREKRQAYERELTELRSQQSKQPAPAEATEAATLPTLESVGYDEAKYAEAVSAFYANQVDSMLSKREQQREAEQSQLELSTKLNEFNAKGMALGEDYRALVLENDLLPITETMRDSFLFADNGAEVLLQLARGGKLEGISKLSDKAQSFEIGKLSERMKRTAETVSEKPKAPEVEVPQSITSIRAEGGNAAVAPHIPDPLETTFNR